jgi:hypothetical protein
MIVCRSTFIPFSCSLFCIRSTPLKLKAAFPAAFKKSNAEFFFLPCSGFSGLFWESLVEDGVLGVEFVEVPVVPVLEAELVVLLVFEEAPVFLEDPEFEFPPEDAVPDNFLRIEE